MLLLLAWERRERYARLGLFVGGMAGGALCYLILHAFPFGRDSGQWAAVYAPAYKVLLFEALERHSLDPIWVEKLRGTTS